MTTAPSAFESTVMDEDMVPLMNGITFLSVSGLDQSMLSVRPWIPTEMSKFSVALMVTSLSETPASKSPLRLTVILSVPDEPGVFMS